MRWFNARRERAVSLSGSPLLRDRLPAGRSKFVMILFFCGFLGLVARAFWVQVVSTDFYAEQGRKRYQATLELPANRGKITDRAGRMLAVSLPASAIWAIPEDLPPDLPAARFNALAQLLELAPAELKIRLDSEKSFVYLKRQVEPAVAARIAALEIDGIHQIRESKRFYPEGEVAAHIIGFTDVEGHGQEGIELSGEATLAGTAGRRGVIRDRLGRVIDDAGLLKAARDGNEMVLTIDSRVQNLAFGELRQAIEVNHAKAGAAVVMDANTGAILALANWPAYNPNQRAHLAGEQLRNRALTDSFEPGSTIKPLNIALALEQQRVQPQTLIDTAPGWYRIGGYTIRDTRNHGVLSVAQIIQMSSNIGMLKVMLEVPPRDMWEMFYAVGLGRLPSVQFPGAAVGRVRPYKSWRPVEQATMSYGYGLSVSLLQLAQSYTIFAAGGEFTPASIVAGNSPQQRVRVISPATAAALRDMLELAVAPGGTATMGRIAGYRVGAKTGTARKQEGRGYAANQYRAVFVGMAPMSAPRVIVAVMIDAPQGRSRYGGPVAGPAFANIMRETLRLEMVPPDLPDDDLRVLAE